MYFVVAMLRMMKLGKMDNVACSAGVIHERTHGLPSNAAALARDRLDGSKAERVQCSDPPARCVLTREFQKSCRGKG